MWLTSSTNEHSHTHLLHNSNCWWPLVLPCTRVHKTVPATYCYCCTPPPNGDKMDDSLKVVQVEMKYRTEIKSRHSLRRRRSSAERCYPIFHTLQNPVTPAVPSWGVWSWWDPDWCSSHHTQGINGLPQPTGWLHSPVPHGKWWKITEVKDDPLSHGLGMWISTFAY